MHQRYQMKLARFVEEVAEKLDLRDPRILQALASVPRHLFVDEALQPRAYTDDALPIGHGQTISKLSTVAQMTAALDPQPKEHILEIGTGSGYQAAVLSRLADEVHSVERIGMLALRAQRVFHRLGIFNVRVRTGDGSLGWAEVAPFDKIIVTAAADRMPEPLLTQLKVGGRLVVPVADGELQALQVVIRRTEEEWEERTIDHCRFVPLLKGVVAR